MYNSSRIDVWELSQRLPTLKHKNWSLALIRQHIQVVKGLSKHWVVSGFLWQLRRHGGEGFQASDFLLPRLHPPPSSQRWGQSHPVKGCINSILIFPNCCLYQVLSLWMNTDPQTVERCFLSNQENWGQCCVISSQLMVTFFDCLLYCGGVKVKVYWLSLHVSQGTNFY